MKARFVIAVIGRFVSRILFINILSIRLRHAALLLLGLSPDMAMPRYIMRLLGFKDLGQEWRKSLVGAGGMGNVDGRLLW